MSETQASTEVMESTAKKFEQVDQSLQKALTDLLQRLEPLQQAFQGAGGKSFTDVKIAWSEDQKSLHLALTKTAEAIRTSGTSYTSSDTAAQQRFGGVNQGTTNLPL